MDTSTVETPLWTTGDKLAKARRNARLSQQDLALDLGIGRRSIVRYEEDQAKPSRAIRIAWAVRCRVPVEWLLEDDSEPASNDRRGRGDQRRSSSACTIAPLVARNTSSDTEERMASVLAFERPARIAS